MTLDNLSANIIMLENNDLKIAQVFASANPKSIKDIVSLIKRYPDLNWDSIKTRITDIYYNMLDKNNEPDLYFSRGYLNSNLEKQDVKNKGNILLINDVLAKNILTDSNFDDNTISEIKSELTHVDEEGRNYFEISNPLYTKDDIKKIVDAISFYEMQIERQAALTCDWMSNLFTNYIKQRRAILKKEVLMITEYLLVNSDENYLWSNLTNEEKEELFSLVNGNSLDGEIIRENIIDSVSNYVTLPEAKNVANKDYKSLKRFIIR